MGLCSSGVSSRNSRHAVTSVDTQLLLLFARLAILQALINLLADGQGQPRDFSFSCQIGFCLSWIEFLWGFFIVGCGRERGGQEGDYLTLRLVRN